MCVTVSLFLPLRVQWRIFPNATSGAGNVSLSYAVRVVSRPIYTFGDMLGPVGGFAGGSYQYGDPWNPTRE
jgi:hypothetical protein